MFRLCYILVIIQIGALRAQKSAGVEQYYYTGATTSQIVPRIYYQNKVNWIGEVRYNYEAPNTLSLNVGKTFAMDRNSAIKLTPFGGLLAGGMKGGNVGSNISVESNSIFFSAETQYSFSWNEAQENFFYNWSELGYQVGELFYAGLALQYTRPMNLMTVWEPGVMMGLTYKNWTLPLYAFNPTTSSRNFVLGINWEWNQKMKKANY